MTHADLPLGPKPIEGTKHGEAKCAELASPQNEWLEPGFAPLKNLICSFFFDLEMVMSCPFSNLKPPT
jgi:hypothetical protein